MLLVYIGMSLVCTRIYVSVYHSWVLVWCFGHDRFRATLFVLIAKHGVESGTCGETDVCAAIKTLESKLEKINALFIPPGKLELSELQRNFLVSVFLYRALHPSLISLQLSLLLPVRNCTTNTSKFTVRMSFDVLFQNNRTVTLRGSMLKETLKPSLAKQELVSKKTTKTSPERHDDSNTVVTKV